MMNKKLIALFVAISTVAAISADCYVDADGNKSCDGIVRNTGRVAGDAVTGSADIVGGTIGGLFGGKGVQQRMDERAERKAQKNLEWREKQEQKRIDRMNRMNRE